jgi:hypothetical protein
VSSVRAECAGRPCVCERLVDCEVCLSDGRRGSAPSCPPAPAANSPGCMARAPWPFACAKADPEDDAKQVGASGESRSREQAPSIRPNTSLTKTGSAEGHIVAAAAAGRGAEGRQARLREATVTVAVTVQSERKHEKRKPKRYTDTQTLLALAGAGRGPARTYECTRTRLPRGNRVMAPKGKKKGKSDSVKASQARPESPDWPAFTPLLPEAHLALHEVLPAQIVTIPNFWTAALCRTYVAFLSLLPLTTTPGKPKKGDAVRVNDRFQIDDPSFAERLWSQTSLQALVTGAAGDGHLVQTEAQRKELWGGHVVGLNPNIRIYRYTKGQFFDQHCEQALAS